jgi:hypothetical protein
MTDFLDNLRGDLNRLLDDLKIQPASDFGVLMGLLMTIATDPAACARRLKELEAASADARDLIERANKVTATLAIERAQHAETLRGLSARQQSEHEARLHEARNILAAAEALKREADEKLQKAYAVEHATANRIADMTQRFAHSGAK